jgi:hypothetical protein
MPAPRRFDVFGKIMIAEPSPKGWQLLVLGADGKRSPVDVVIPHFVHEHELEQYLDDLFHEMATPANPCVKPLSP